MKDALCFLPANAALLFAAIAISSIRALQPLFARRTAAVSAPVAANLYPTLFPYETRDAIKRALSDELDAETASRLAFHLVDWNGDAAFLVALLLFPGRFTSEEIREGVASFLMHAPNHVAAAAKLGGWSVGDSFRGDLFEPEPKPQTSH
jgi:hypothetical protein